MEVAGIESVNGIPVAEPNHRALYILARYNASEYPGAGELLRELVSAIQKLVSCGQFPDDREAAERLINEFRSKCGYLTGGYLSGGKDYPLFVPDDHENIAYLKAFIAAGAASALVELYLSPIAANRAIAKRAIEIFFGRTPCPRFVPGCIRVLWARILLDLCRRLAAEVNIEEDLHYIACRKALARVLSNSWLPLASGQLYDVVEQMPLFIGELIEWAISALEDEYMSVGQPILTELSNLLSAMWWVFKRYQYEGWFDSLDMLFRKFLSAVDDCLTRVEDYMQQTGEQVQIKLHIPVWARLFEVLTVLDSFAKIFDGAEPEQLLHEVLLKRRVALNFILRWAKRNGKLSLFHEKLCWLLKHKDVTDVDSKGTLLLIMLLKVKDDGEPYNITVDRSRLLAESFEYIGQVDTVQLQRRFSLEFINEEARGDGVLREWLVQLCQEIFNPLNGLFLSCPYDRRRFFPNRASGNLKRFGWSGRVIALALMHGVQVGIMFDRVFFLKLAGQPITLEDVKDADPQLYQSCREILEMDAGVLDPDGLGLTFAIEIEELGSRRTVELRPGGKEIKLNSNNRTQYVELLIKYLFVTSVCLQTGSFLSGFAEFLSDRTHWQHIFRMDLKEDFDLILCGNVVIDVEEWKAYTEYDGYEAEDPQISWFWEIVEDMTEQQRGMLLFFWTSVKSLPVGGFGSLDSKLYITRSSSSEDRLPTSQTCFYRLSLPPYQSESVMLRQLRLITQEHVSCSFGLS